MTLKWKPAILNLLRTTIDTNITWKQHLCYVLQNICFKYKIDFRLGTISPAMFSNNVTDDGMRLFSMRLLQSYTYEIRNEKKKQVIPFQHRASQSRKKQQQNSNAGQGTDGFANMYLRDDETQFWFFRRKRDV